MKTQYANLISNECSCADYNEETDEYTPSEYCYGWCWEDALDEFRYSAEEFLKNANDYWRVDNLRLWDGETSGFFHAKTVADIICGMTVRSGWTMEYNAYPDRIEYSLSHHDAPMGSRSTLRIATDEEVEKIFGVTLS